MPDQADEGPHVHQPCSRCGLVEAETGGLCPECATQLADTDELSSAEQAQDPGTADLDRP